MEKKAERICLLGSAMMVARDDRQQMVRFLAYVTGLVNQKLLLQNEYLNAETGFSGLTCRNAYA